MSKQKSTPLIENIYFCPLCKGQGIIQMDDPRRKEVDIYEVKKEMAVKLREKGFSLRQIQKALGYKSVRSVVYILDKKENLKSK